MEICSPIKNKLKNLLTTELFKGLNLFIFILTIVIAVIALIRVLKKDKFPDTETMPGGGILLSALILFIATYIVKQEFNE